MVDLTKYAGISRKGRIIKYENRLNEYPFPTEEEAKKFERLYNSLAVEALKEMMSIIKEKNIVRDAEKLSEEDLAFHAGQYFTHGGVHGIRAPTLGGIEKKANKLYELSKDFKLLKKVGLI